MLRQSAHVHTCKGKSVDMFRSHKQHSGCDDSDNLACCSQVHDEKDKDFELEISWICPASNYQARGTAIPSVLCSCTSLLTASGLSESFGQNVSTSVYHECRRTTVFVRLLRDPRRSMSINVIMKLQSDSRESWLEMVN